VHCPLTLVCAPVCLPAVVDVDGNGFSSRFHRLAQHGGLVIKQASNLPGYFEHLLAPNVSFLQASTLAH